MTEQEFSVWLEDFERKFPSKSRWLSDKLGTLREWRAVLAPVQLRDALAANTRIHEGRDSYGDDWDLIASQVRRVSYACRGDREAVEAGQRRSDDEDSNTCDECRGGGLVIRYDEKGRAIGFACHCPRGERWVAEGRRVKPPRLPKRYEELTID